MQQHSREANTTNVQFDASGLLAAGSPWLALLSSVQSLLAHTGLMLAITAGLMLINLLVTPGTLWSSAIVVIWLVVLVAHAVGLVISRLLSYEASTSDPSPRVHAEPHAGPLAPWMNVNGHRETETVAAAHTPSRPDGNDSDPWKNVAAPADETETSWPQAPTATAEPDLPDTDGLSKSNGHNADASDKVPWRAATEIAWLRRPRAAEDGERDQRGSGS